MEKRGIDVIHAIKLDTQGSELDILRGAEKALRGCIFVIVEAEFNPLYEGQPLFCDVDRFLRDRGFSLWRLGNLAHYSTGMLSAEPHSMVIGTDPGGHQNVAFANGQLFWSDAFYVKEAATPVSDKTLPLGEAVAGAALVSQWRFWDLAIEMIRKSGNSQLLLEVRTLIDATFTESSRNRYSAAEFRSQVLPVVNPDFILTLETDFSVTDTCVIYGPYLQLPWGKQEVTFHVQAVGLGDQELISAIGFDVAVDTTRIASVDIVGLEGNKMLQRGEVKLRFYNNAPKGLFEFRTFTWGRPFKGKLVFFGVSVRRL
jgi:hypothetical protein